MYKDTLEHTHERNRKLDQMTSGGRNTRKTHKRKLDKRMSNKRQRKSRRNK